QLIEHAQLHLCEVRRDVPQRTIFRSLLSDGVLLVVRRRRDQLLAERVGLPEAPRVEVRSERESHVTKRADAVPGGGDQVVVDLEVAEVVARYVAEGVETGRHWQSFETPVGPVVSAEGFVDL